MKKGYSDISFLETAEAKKVSADGVIKRGRGRPKKPNMKQFTIRMEASIHNNLKEYASNSGENTSSIIQRVIREFLINKT